MNIIYCRETDPTTVSSFQEMDFSAHRSNESNITDSNIKATNTRGSDACCNTSPEAKTARSISYNSTEKSSALRLRENLYQKQDSGTDASFLGHARDEHLASSVDMVTKQAETNEMHNGIPMQFPNENTKVCGADNTKNETNVNYSKCLIMSTLLPDNKRLMVLKVTDHLSYITLSQIRALFRDEQRNELFPQNESQEHNDKVESVLKPLPFKTLRRRDCPELYNMMLRYVREE